MEIDGVLGKGDEIVRIQPSLCAPTCAGVQALATADRSEEFSRQFSI